MTGVSAAEAVATLELPKPFDIGELLREVSVRRGRSIELRSVATPPGAPCGFWIAMRDVDYICFESDTTRLHQEHIILHELGHILCGHQRGEPSVEMIARILLPNLDPDIVRKVLARTVYSDPDEEQAELFATLILAGSGLASSRVAHRDSPTNSAVVERIESILAYNR